MTRGGFGRLRGKRGVQLNGAQLSAAAGKYSHDGEEGCGKRTHLLALVGCSSFGIPLQDLWRVAETQSSRLRRTRYITKGMCSEAD